MTLTIHNELNGLQVETTITTLNVETHSAITEVSKEVIEDFKYMVGQLLKELLAEANDCRKVTG